MLKLEERFNKYYNKIALIESRNSIKLVRGDADYTSNSETKKYTGIFFEPANLFNDNTEYNGYGKLSRWELSIEANIFEGKDVESFIEQQLAAVPKKVRSIIKKLYIRHDLEHILSILDNINWKYDQLWDATKDDPEAVKIWNMGELFMLYQIPARYILESKGFDGAHWANQYNDELSPNQYQIWNINVLKKI